jgi:signal transduction histidine kinase
MEQMKSDELIVFTSAFILLFMLSGLFIVLVFRYKNRILQNQIEFVNAILQAHENEQERIARDLHDQISPTISIVKTQIECINIENPNKTDAEIKADVVQQLQHVINDVRNIAHNLIPTTFGEYGFIKSVEYYILRIGEYNAIRTLFVHPHSLPSIGKNNEIALYRIIQELFQNTLKHAQATEAKLEIDCDNTFIQIKYTDNGIGFANDQLVKGIGLSNIDSRVKLLGGTIKTTSTIGEGVSVVIKIKTKHLLHG